MVADLKGLYDDLSLDRLRVIRPSKFLFLCGGGIVQDQTAKPQNLRDYLYRVRPMRSSYDIVLAETAVQLYRDTDYQDLIAFEEDIARIASVVLVIAESEGSLTELGAFATNDTIRNALRVVVQTKFATAESFVRWGPVERVRKTRRENLAVYPWKIHANGRLNVRSTIPHYREIVQFINGHIDAIPTSMTFKNLGESALFYIIYWIVYLCLAVTRSKLHSYIISIFPDATKEKINNKVFCMRLAGWIGEESYGPKDYLYTLHDPDPFDYSFKPGVRDNDSVRRKYAVSVALQKSEVLPRHIREVAARAREP